VGAAGTDSNWDLNDKSLEIFRRTGDKIRKQSKREKDRK
jgi:hypothetical protein